MITLLLLTVVILLATIAVNTAPKSKKHRLQASFLISKIDQDGLVSNILIKGKNMSVTLSEVQFVDGQVTPENRLGKPSKVEAGSVSYVSSDPDIATVVKNPDDETKFQIIAHAPGVSQVNFSADADLGAGVVTITGFVAVEVLPEQATGFGITLGTPQDQA